jgi:hypothetical protein
MSKALNLAQSLVDLKNREIAAAARSGFSEYDAYFHGHAWAFRKLSSVLFAAKLSPEVLEEITHAIENADSILESAA